MRTAEMNLETKLAVRALLFVEARTPASACLPPEHLTTFWGPCAPPLAARRIKGRGGGPAAPGAGGGPWVAAGAVCASVLSVDAPPAQRFQFRPSSMSRPLTARVAEPFNRSGRAHRRTDDVTSRQGRRPQSAHTPAEDRAPRDRTTRHSWDATASATPGRVLPTLPTRKVWSRLSHLRRNVGFRCP